MMCSDPVRNVLSCMIRRHIHVNWGRREGGREGGVRERDAQWREERVRGGEGRG